MSEKTTEYVVGKGAGRSDWRLLDRPFLVIDVESMGLHGEAFAVAGVFCADPALAIEPWEFSFACPVPDGGGSEDRKWVLENVRGIEATHDSPRAMRDAFWEMWQRAKALGAWMAADCSWPVEARFLAQCIDDDPEQRKWEGPYPFLDIGSVLATAGHDPLAHYERLPEEEPAHDPLKDATQSARLLMDYGLMGDAEVPWERGQDALATGGSSPVAEAVELLERFNAWRRGNEDLEQPDPGEIGRAIDVVCGECRLIEASVALMRRMKYPQVSYESSAALRNSPVLGDPADDYHGELERFCPSYPDVVPEAVSLKPRRFFVPLDTAQVAEEVGAMCGHGALAAALEIPLAVAWELFPQEEREKGWVNIPMMKAAIKKAGFECRKIPGDPSPVSGESRGLPQLVMVQWLGPWTEPGVPPAAACAHRHWVAMREDVVWDINWPAEWLDFYDWMKRIEELMPEKATGSALSGTWEISKKGGNRPPPTSPPFKGGMWDYFGGTGEESRREPWGLGRPRAGATGTRGEEGKEEA